MPLPTRDQAWSLLCQWVQSDSLRKHMLAVEAAMRAYARKYGEDEELWGITGLLHDLDFERYPDMDDPVDGHPRSGLRLFRELDYPQALIHAVEGHAPYLGIARASRMDSALVAVDELTGLDHGGGLRASQQGSGRRDGQVGAQEVEGPGLCRGHQPRGDRGVHGRAGRAAGRAHRLCAGGAARDRR